LHHGAERVGRFVPEALGAVIFGFAQQAQAEEWIGGGNVGKVNGS
jgi:hypothetical protein